MSKIAVLVPCYNEAQTIGKVVREYREALPEADIYVYDNNSTDGTDELAREAGAIVRYEYRQGKGNVIRSMFRDIEADCYLMIDGDDTYRADKAAYMCDLVLEGKADMVVGDRLSSSYFEENKRRFHGSGNKLVRKMINLFFPSRKPIFDVMTGMRAMSPLFAKTFPILSQGFEIETEMTIHALDKNLLIKNVPINYQDRPAGSFSKLNTYSDGVKVILTILNLCREYKPLQFFGIIAGIFLLMGLALFLPVLAEYFATAAVPRFPTLIVSVAFMVLSVALFLCGLILDTSAKNSRKNLEVQMNIIRMQLSHEA